MDSNLQWAKVKWSASSTGIAFEVLELQESENGKFSSKFPEFQLSDGEDVVLKLLDVDPGDVVIFHDNLIHQGAL